MVGSRGFNGTAKAETKAPAMDITMVKYNLSHFSRCLIVAFPLFSSICVSTIKGFHFSMICL